MTKETGFEIKTLVTVVPYISYERYVRVFGREKTLISKFPYLLNDTNIRFYGRATEIFPDIGLGVSVFDIL